MAREERAAQEGGRGGERLILFAGAAELLVAAVGLAIYGPAYLRLAEWAESGQAEQPPAAVVEQFGPAAVAAVLLATGIVAATIGVFRCAGRFGLTRSGRLLVAASGVPLFWAAIAVVIGASWRGAAGISVALAGFASLAAVPACLAAAGAVGLGAQAPGAGRGGKIVLALQAALGAVLVALFAIAWQASSAEPAGMEAAAAVIQLAFIAAALPMALLGGSLIAAACAAPGAEVRAAR
jgi:hypothetical protein